MQENINKNCRSLEPELDERSRSFTELKKIFQDPNLSHALLKSYSSSDAIDALENKAKTSSVKRKDNILMTAHKSHSKSKGSVLDQTVSNDTQNPVQDINQELLEKLSVKKSVDKLSARFSNVTRRKNKQKVKATRKIV